MQPVGINGFALSPIGASLDAFGLAIDFVGPTISRLQRSRGK
jgi:hypothetical protein